MRLKQETRSETVINKSRFITCAAPVRTEAEARDYIALIRHAFPDSTHVCTAYIIGETGALQRSSDNGEPAGTAGIPILEAIRHSGLTDTCVAVVRYFGGIKQDTLNNAAKVRDIPLAVYTVTYPYDLSGIVEGWLRRNCEILDLAYDEQVTCTFAGSDETIPATIKDLSKGQCEAVYLRTETREIDV